MSAEVVIHPATLTRRFQLIRDAEGTAYIIDTCDVMPSPPGLFVIVEGGESAMRRLAHVPFSNPAAVDIIGDENGQRERTETRDLTIRGRVIGKWVSV